MTAASADWVGVTDGEAGGRYCTILYILYCTVLYCTVLHYSVLGRVRSRDGVYRDWSVARWARRMHMDR